MARREFWTILIVTGVTILIWFWAAGETIDNRQLGARVAFTLPEPEAWLVSPSQGFVSISMEGSKLALQRAEQVVRRDISLPLAASVGRQTVDLANALRASRDLEATGVKVLSVEPATIDVDIDAMTRVRARVRAALPGLQTVGEVEITPAEVTLTMPSALRARFPGDLVVEAYVDRTRLDDLEPGLQHTIDARLRATEGMATADGVRITPGSVRLSFTVRSRTRELLLNNVRVQLAGPPEDHREYLVEIADTVLRGVTITAEADLVRRIEANEVTVVAMLHLSNRDKEQGITRKAITYFLALVPDERGTMRGVVIDGRVDGAATLPEVNLSITRRTAPP